MTLTSYDAPPEPALADDGPAAHESESALARGTRWIRHAPAERAPLAGVPAVWTATELMHAAGVSPGFTGAAAVAAAGLAYGIGERRQGGEHPRMRGAELAAAAGAVGAWATAAATWGPLGGPDHLLTIVYGVGVAGGYWWLRTHEAVKAARARRDAAAAEAAEWLARRAEWHRLAARVGLQGSHLMERPEPNLNGETWLIDTYSTGKLASQIDCRQLAQRLAGERSVPRGRVEVTPDPEWVYRLRVFFRAGDPWKGGSADAFIWHPWASGDYDPDAPFAELLPPAPSILDPLPLGADPETGAPLELPLFGEKGANRVLVIATSGSGKSMLLDTIRERITACPDARLLQVNLSKGVEDAWWEPLTEASALATDPNPAGRALAILDFLTGAYKARPQAPARKAGARWHRPVPGEPALVLIIDEYDEVSRDPERKQAAETLLSKCRSEAIPVILATQRPVGKWVSPSLKANVSHLVWSKMRAGDARHLVGNEGFELPDMGAYGGGNPGIFGVCEHPTWEGMPYLRGRAFFWGDHSPGLLRLIAARAATREPYILEAALAHLADPWAQITGAAPAPASDSRYDVTTTRDGTTVPGVASVRDRLARVRGILGGQQLPGGSGDHDQAAEAALDGLLARPGGVSTREAADVLPWQKTKIHELLAKRVAAGMAEVRGEGRSARFYAVVPLCPFPPLRAVPDSPSEASDSVS
jgi:hypothetical protein